MVWSNILYFILFFVFVLSPFDIFLNFNVFGFSFRLVSVFMFLFIVIASFILFRNRDKLILPLWFIFLVIACFLNSIFVFNSILIVRGISYAIWFWFFVIFVFVLVNVGRILDFGLVLKGYILSFVLHALFGLLQQALYYVWGIAFFVTQFGRMNGFTYEPSYFVTYLSSGFVLTLFCAMFLGKSSFKDNWFFYLSLSIIALALVFSTSKFLIIILVLSTLLVFTFFVVWVRKFKAFFKTFFSNLFVSLLSFVLVFGFYSFIIFYLPKITSVEVSLVSKIKEIEAEKESVSFGPRVKEFLNTLEVAFKNPIIGTSLGGVAPHKAVNQGVIPKSNQDVKPFEGISIYAEMLAGLGIFGFFIMVLFFLKFFWDGFRQIGVFLDKGYLEGFSILGGLVFGLFVELVLLVFNQNFLRFYLWTHIGILAMFLENSKRSYKF